MVFIVVIFITKMIKLYYYNWYNYNTDYKYCCFCYYYCYYYICGIKFIFIFDIYEVKRRIWGWNKLVFFLYQSERMARFHPSLPARFQKRIIQTREKLQAFETQIIFIYIYFFFFSFFSPNETFTIFRVWNWIYSGVWGFGVWGSCYVVTSRCDITKPPTDRESPRLSGAPNPLNTSFSTIFSVLKVPLGKFWILPAYEDLWPPAPWPGVVLPPGEASNPITKVTNKSWTYHPKSIRIDVLFNYVL